eukprot:17784-Eustigmatos_ZCMA.PRE.1
MHLYTNAAANISYNHTAMYPTNLERHDRMDGGVRGSDGRWRRIRRRFRRGGVLSRDDGGG